MPKKKNFLGGMQNYNPNTGEYEPALEGANGEKPSSFKSFKKQDSEFKKANDKRLGKVQDKDVPTLSNKERLAEGGLKGRFERAGYNVSNVSDKEMTVEGRFRIVDIGNGGFDVYDGEEKIAEDIGNQKDFVSLIESRLNEKNVNSELTKEAPKKYFKHPQVDGVWHDTGEVEEKYGNKYKIYENEEGHKWGVSDSFLKQFEEVEEPKHPFKLDKEKYPDVEETPYGFAYNVGNQTITDIKAQNKAFGRDVDNDKEYGFTLTVDGDEVYYNSFDEAYAAAKKGSEPKDEEGVGKVIKYRPFLSGAGGDRWGDEEIRAKKLNNGIAMETKKFKSGGQFNKDENGKYVPKQYYKLVDIESGLSVGKAESYEEALAKSKDPEFVEKLERAREAYWKKHPDRRESKPQKGDKTKLTEEEKVGVKDIDSKKAMLKARKYMEKFWANTSAGNHMRSEMDYILSNFENDNDKEGAIALAKDNIKKWQRIGFLDQSGNELRDEKLAYFNRMVEYMEKNK